MLSGRSISTERASSQRRAGARVAALRLVVIACAISAGIHGALTPAHFEEGGGAGAGFLAATVLLGGLVVALTRWPASALAPAAAVPLLAGLIVSYALAVTTGLPLLHPEVEPLVGLALFTKAVEAIALAAALALVPRRPVDAANLRSKGTQTWTGRG